MSDFAVRVELHHASEAQYQSLHNAMERAGYTRYIVGGNGVRYQLPTAMYQKMFNGVVTAAAVRDQVLPIAEAIVPSAWVFVARYDDTAWTLVPAKAAA